jgi:hypothetical protein
LRTRNSLFIKTEFTFTNLELPNLDKNVVRGFEIWSIKRIHFTNWYELTLGVYIAPLDKDKLGSFGGHKLKFKLKRKNKTYKIVKIIDDCGFI